MKSAAPIESLLGTLFAMRKRSEMTHEEFLLANATWVEKHVASYPILYPPEIPDRCANYIARRLSGGGFDHGSASELGRWFQLAIRIMDDTRANADLMNWAMERLNSVGFAHPNITRALERYSRMTVPQAFLDASEVKRRDAEIPVGVKLRGTA